MSRKVKVDAKSLNGKSTLCTGSDDFSGSDSSGLPKEIKIPKDLDRKSVV